MNISSKLYRPSAAVLAAGGFCWVTKFVVIAATDGATSGAPDTATAVLYITAVALMAIGLAGLGVALLAGRHPLLRAAGAVGGLVTWVVSYMVIETAAKAVAGETGPVWLGEEIGIVATGAVLMSAGLMLARPTPARRSERAALGASGLSTGGPRQREHDVSAGCADRPDGSSAQPEITRR